MDLSHQVNTLDTINLIACLSHASSGRGARVSACAGGISQLHRCRFDSRIAYLENPDTAIVKKIIPSII